MLQKETLEKVFERKFSDEGDNYRALCPVHNERTPSFYVHKSDNLVHCFGCGAKGNLIDFTMKTKGVDEDTALKMLGITLEHMIIPMFNQILPLKKDPKIYPESWLAPFRKEIHKYVIRRGFTMGTICTAEGCFDSHHKRQVFPHRNREGKLLGAIGRSCREQEPKWYFYWGYEKGRCLYRAPTPTPCIPDSIRSVWVVEGVFDALWLYQHGYNAVATLGSKPTKHQISEIVDNYDEIVLGYDNDAAGIEGVRYLYRKLKDKVTCLVPLWPKKANDIMDVNPDDLRLYNLVQWEFIRTSKERSRVLNKQKESSAPA